MEARELCKGLRAHANGFTEHATEVPLAYTEVDGDGVHVGARELFSGGEDELRVSVAPSRGREPFGDRTLQDCSRSDRVARVGELIAQSSRRVVAPQFLERDDAPGDCRGWHAEHCSRCAELKARHHDPLPAADELSLHPLPYTERVYLETISRRRPEANDELDLWTWNRDARAVAVAVPHDQRRYCGRGLCARRKVVVGNGARVHETSLSARATLAQAFEARLSVFSNLRQAPMATFSL